MVENNLGRCSSDARQRRRRRRLQFFLPYRPKKKGTPRRSRTQRDATRPSARSLLLAVVPRCCSSPLRPVSQCADSPNERVTFIRNLTRRSGRLSDRLHTRVKIAAREDSCARWNGSDEWIGDRRWIFGEETGCCGSRSRSRRAGTHVAGRHVIAKSADRLRSGHSSAIGRG